jgi:excinuclease ABC subunit B
MYADKMTDAMKKAIDETNRRRAKQKAYNDEHGIEPAGIIKEIHDLTEQLGASHVMAEGRAAYQTSSGGALPDARQREKMQKGDLERIIGELENQMKAAARELEFERAAALRDQIIELRAILAEESNLPPWKKARLMAGEV